MNIQKFVDHVRAELQSQGGTLRLANTKNVMADNLTCGGYFDEEVPNISVAINKPKAIWVPTLCHEFSHFEQWREDSAIWRSSTLPDGTDAGNIMDEWLEGEDHEPALVKDCVAKYRRLELDCERRTVKNLIKFKLPVCPKAYCMRANAYVHFYNFIYCHRRWYKRGKAPYQIPEILETMPTNLDGRYDRTPQWLMKLFDEHC